MSIYHIFLLSIENVQTNKVSKNHSFPPGCLQLLNLSCQGFVFFPQNFQISHIIGIVVDDVGMLLLIGKDIFVDFLDFFLEVINLSPDHRQFLLNPILIVSIDQLFILIVNVS